MSRLKRYHDSTPTRSIINRDKKSEILYKDKKKILVIIFERVI